MLNAYDQIKIERLLKSSQDDMNKDGKIFDVLNVIKTVEIDGYEYEIYVGIRRKMEDEDEE